MTQPCPFSRPDPRLRWLVPVGAAAAVLAGGVAIGAITAGGRPALPARSPAELLADCRPPDPTGCPAPWSTRADLGLPALPARLAPVPAGSAADLTSLVAGTHTLRVWYSGPDKARVALLGTLGETDVITNGRDVWIWNSRANQATHRTLPERAGRPSGPAREPAPGPPRPAASRRDSWPTSRSPPSARAPR